MESGDGDNGCMEKFKASQIAATMNSFDYKDY